MRSWLSWSRRWMSTRILRNRNRKRRSGWYHGSVSLRRKQVWTVRCRIRKRIWQGIFRAFTAISRILKIASAMSDCTFWERCRRGKRSSMKYWLFFVCRMGTSPRSVSCWLRRRGHPWIRCWDRHRHFFRMVSPGASGWLAYRRRQRVWFASWQKCISTKRRRRHWGQRGSSRCFVSFVRRYIRVLQRQKRKWSIPFAGFLPVTLCRGSPALRTRAVSLFCRQG